MTCVICSKKLTGRQTSVCSRTCSIKHNGNKRREAGKLRKENMTPEAYARKSAAGKRDSDKHRLSRLALRVCAVCGETRWINKGHAKTRLKCHKCVNLSGCKDIAIRTPPRHYIPKIIKGSVIYFQGCKQCGTQFLTQHSPGKYCSSACKQHVKPSGKWITKSKRLALYKRDAWTCLICYKPVSTDTYSSSTYNPDYPSLDHIIPRSLGGSNQDSNLRTTHVHCNAVRGVKMATLEPTLTLWGLTLGGDL